MSRIDSVGIAAQNGTGPNWMGTKETTMDYFPPVESGAPDPNMDVMSVDETIGSRFPTDREVGGVHYEPTFKGKVRNTHLPRLLSAFMGDPVTTPKAAGVYEHVLDCTDPAAIPRAASILMTRADPVPNIVDLFFDALGDDLTLTIETGNWLEFDAKYIARSLDDSQAAPTVVQDLTRKFPFYTMAAFISINGAAEVPVALQKVESKWTGNISTDALQLGSRDLYRIAPGNVDLEVTWTILQDLADYYRRAFLIDPEPLALRLLAQGPVISGTDHHEVELTVHRAIETEAKADIDAGNTLLGAEITSQAALDPTTGKFFTVRVQNAVPDYVVS